MIQTITPAAGGIKINNIDTRPPVPTQTPAQPYTPEPDYTPIIQEPRPQLLGAEYILLTPDGAAVTSKTPAIWSETIGNRLKIDAEKQIKNRKAEILLTTTQPAKICRYLDEAEENLTEYDHERKRSREAAKGGYIKIATEADAAAGYALELAERFKGQALSAISENRQSADSMRRQAEAFLADIEKAAAACRAQIAACNDIIHAADTLEARAKKIDIPKE